MSTLRLVEDIVPGSIGSGPFYFTAVGNTLFFRAQSWNGNRLDIELWKSDGTSDGTSLVKDINPSPFSVGSQPNNLVSVGQTLFFLADDGSSGEELWKSDGTSAGTTRVADIRPGRLTPNSQFFSSDARDLTAVGNTLFFVANDGSTGYELWKSDGTGAGTSRVADIRIGTTSSHPQFLTAIGNTLFFSVDYWPGPGVDSSFGLWKSDGTSAGTTRVAGTSLGAGASLVRHLTAVGNTLFFVVYNGSIGNELWRSDGTSLGTFLVRDFNTNISAFSDQSSFTAIGNTLFFTANDGSRHEIWRSDGTSNGTSRVTDISLSSSGYIPHNLTTVGDTLFFTFNDGSSGNELWKSDGSSTGTRRVADINPGIIGSNPFNLKAIGDTLVFSANDGSSGFQLWKSDGTSTGTTRFPQQSLGFGAIVGTTLFISGDDGSTGPELWALDVSEVVGETNNGAAVFAIRGTPVVGNTLTIVNSNVDPDGNGIFTYRWERSVDGNSWSAVEENSAIYTITSSDIDKQLRVVASYSDGKGFRENVTTSAGTILGNAALGKREIVPDINLSNGQSSRFSFRLPEKVIQADRFSVDSYDLHFHLRDQAGHLVSDVAISLFEKSGTPIASWEKVEAGKEIYVELGSLNSITGLELYADILKIHGKVYGPDARNVFISNYSASAAVKQVNTPKLFTDSWIISHGWNDRSTNAMFTDLAEVIDTQYQGEALLLDWGDAADTPLEGREGIQAGQNYDAAKWIQDVALFAAYSLVNIWNYRAGSYDTGVNLIGHSLGAYLSSYLGQLLSDYSSFSAKPDRLVALDPAEYVSIGNRGFYDISNNVQGLVLNRFDQNATSSLALYGELQQIFNGDGSGDGSRAREADYTFNVDFKEGDAGVNHNNIVRLFTNLIDTIATDHKVRDFFDLRGIQGIKQDNGDDGNFLNVGSNGTIESDTVLDEVYLTDIGGPRTKKIKADGVYYLGGKRITALDGYIANGLVFLDLNGNGLRDPEEPEANSLFDGSIRLYLSQGNLDAVESPGASASLIFQPTEEAVDLSTGLPFQTSLASPFPAGVITPLTTLVHALMSNGWDIDSSIASVRQAFGISSSIDLLNYDPLVQVNFDSANATNVFSSGAAVQNIVSQLTSLLQIHSALSPSQLSFKIYSSLASYLTTYPADFGRADVIQDIIAYAINEAAIVLPSEVQHAVPDIAYIIAEGQQRISQITQSDSYSYLEEVVKIQVISQGLISAAISDFSSNPLSLSFDVEGFSGESLTQLVNGAQIANLLPPTVDPAIFSISEVPYNQFSTITAGFILGSIVAFDPEGLPLTYSLVSNQDFDSDLDLDRDGLRAFEINQITGQVLVSDPDDLDFEQSSSFLLSVIVTDGALSSIAPLQINLSDVVDAPVPSFQANDGSALFSLFGVPAVGNSLEINLLVDDPDLGSSSRSGYWQLSDDGVSWATVDANSFMFLVPSDAEGKFVRAVVTYTDGQGFEETVFLDAVHLPFVDHGDAVFLLTGIPAVGQVLTATCPGADPDGNGSFSYSWQSFNGTSWDSIGNGAGSYTLSDAEEGKQIRVLITYTDGQGFTEVITADPVSVPFVDNGDAAVFIAGIPTVGQVLTAMITVADPDGNGSFAYAWQSFNEGSWDPIGTDNSDYTLSSFEEGQQVRVQVTYTDGQGFAESVISNSVVVPFIDDGNALFSISGTPAVGQILTASLQSSDPDGNGAFEYSWQSFNGFSWSAIGSNASTYSVRPIEEGMEIRVAISYTDGQGFVESVTTLPSTVPFVDDGDAAFTISGTLAAGQTLRAEKTYDDPDGGETFSYSWEVFNGITWDTIGIDSSEVTLDSFVSDLRVNVSYVDSQGFAESVLTSLSDDGDIAFSIDGLPAVGETLALNLNSSDPDGDGEFFVEWQSSSDGVVWDVISTDPVSLLVLPSEEGKTIQVFFSYVDAQGFPERVGSSPVNIPLVDDGPATFRLSGAPIVGGTLAVLLDEPDPDGNGDFLFTWVSSLTDSFDVVVDVLVQDSPESTLVVTAREEGKYIGAIASYFDAQGFQHSVTTAVAIPFTDEGDATFSIAGNPAAGQTLTAVTLADDPDGNGSFSYSWQIYNGSGWSPIGIDSSAFTPSLADVGRQIRVQVSYIDGQGFAESVNSEAVSIPFISKSALITGVFDNVGQLKGILSPVSVTDDRTPTFSGSLSAPLARGESLRIFNGTSLLGTATIRNANRTWTYTPILPTTSGTSYSIVAHVSDSAGNLGPASPAFEFFLDTTPPATTASITRLSDDVGWIQGNVRSGGHADDVSPTISGFFSAPLEAGESLLIFNGTSLLGQATVNNTELTWSFTPNLPVSAGTSYSIVARVSDAAGNLGTASPTYRFRLDTAAPTATAAITAINDNMGSVNGNVVPEGATNDRTPTISGSLSAPLASGETLRIFADGTLLGTARVSNSSRTWSFTPTLPATTGTSYAITARVVDAAGNLGALSDARTFTLDSAAPATTVAITAVNDDVGLLQGAVATRQRTDDVTPTIRGTLSAPLADGEELQIFRGSVWVGNASVNNAAQTWAFTPSLEATAGTSYSFTARVADALGNLGPVSNTRTFTLDTTAPATTATIAAVTDNFGLLQGSISQGGRTDDRSPTFTGNLSGLLASGETLRIFNGSTLLGSASVNNTARTWTFTPSLPASSGTTYAITASVADAAGNLGPASDPFTFTLDTTPNPITGTTNDDLLTLTGAPDLITGLDGSDTIVLPRLSDSLLGSAAEPTFDGITDLIAGVDRIDAPVARSLATAVNPVVLGAVSDLTGSSIAALLSASVFPALTTTSSAGAATFSFNDPTAGTRTFLAINNGTGGFSASTDAIVEITGFSGNLSQLQVY